MAYQMLEFQKKEILAPMSTKVETVVQSSELNRNQLDQNFFQDNNNIPEKKLMEKKAKKNK